MAFVRGSRWPSIVLGLLLIGGAVGYLVAQPVVVQKVTALDASTVGPNPDEALMPSLVGMDLEPAKLAMADSNIDTSMLKLISQGAAGAPGRVLAQDPQSGVGTQGNIYLTVSESIPTPDLRGLDFKEATQRVEEIGGVVRLEQTVAPEADAGSVLSSSPAVGKTMSSVVVLTVADPGSPVPLADLSSLDEEYCDAAYDPSIAGVAYTSGISCSLEEGTVAFAEYSTGGVAAAFRAQVGFDDESAPGSAEVSVLVDGVVVEKYTVPAGAAAEILTPLAGASTLRIEVKGRPAKDDYSSVTFGEAHFSVLPEDAQALLDGIL